MSIALRPDGGRPNTKNTGQTSNLVVGGVRDVKRRLQLGLVVPCGGSGAGRQNGLIGTRPEALGRDYCGFAKAEWQSRPAKAPAGRKNARSLVCLTTCQGRADNAIRQRDGLGQA